MEKSREPLPVEVPSAPTDYATMMRKIQRKLSIMQLIFMALSFFMALSTSMMGGSFGFVFWYAVLGLVSYLFYRNVWLGLLVSFVPIFLWLFVDTFQGWVQGSVEGTGFFGFLLMALVGALVGAGIHTLFALGGMAIGWLFARKKPLTVALSIVLALGVFLVYNELNGNPVSKWIAEQKLEAYLEETYPEEELRVKEGFYNFKFSTYEFEVIAIGTAGADGNPVKYRFGLRGLIPQVVSDGIYDDRLDVALMERLGLEAAEEIKALLEPKVASLREVDVYLEVPGGLLPEDTAWRKGLPVAEEMRIGLTLDAEGLTVQDVSEMARKVQIALDGAGYVYRHVNVQANEWSGADGKDLGPLKYAVSFKRGDDVTDYKVEAFNQD